MSGRMDWAKFRPRGSQEVGERWMGKRPETIETNVNPSYLMERMSDQTN